VILGVGGQALRILQEAKGGIHFQPENSEALAETIMKLICGKSAAKVLGSNGASYVGEHFTRIQSAKLYERILEDLVNDGQSD